MQTRPVIRVLSEQRCSCFFPSPPFFFFVLLPKIVARALGGKVERSQNGWSLGANEIAFDVDKVNKLCGRLSDALRDDDEDGCEKIAIHQVHQDEVIELPPGAQVIASSPECENEAFLVGSHIMGVQVRPNFDLLKLLTHESGCCGLTLTPKTSLSPRATPNSTTTW